MIRRFLMLALTSGLVVSTLSGASSAATGSGTVFNPGTSRDCFAGADGTCSSSATADPSGAFSATANLTSPDAPFTRSSRYAQGLAFYTIGFDLAEATPEATIDVTIDIDEASVSWQQTAPEIFGGATSADSGAKVLFQLLGSGAPEGCGCGWFIQGSPNVVPVRASAVGDAASVSDSQTKITMVANDRFGDGSLPAGHYELLLRAYARVDLVGSGDWGTVASRVTGSVADVTVTTPDAPAEATTLTLALSGTKATRSLTATLTDSASAPVDGKTISFYGDGTLLGTAVTQNGVATLPLSGKFRGGKHVFRAEFAGDEAYQASAAQIGG